MNVIENYWGNALFSVVPTIFLGLLFWGLLRSILRADRTERKIYARMEAEERERLGLDKPAG